MLTKTNIYIKITAIFLALYAFLTLNLCCATRDKSIHKITNNKELKYEPSGIAKIKSGNSDLFLILNDKETDEALYEYLYNDKFNRLLPQKDLFNPFLKISDPEIHKVKWEGITSNNSTSYLLSNTGDIFRLKSANNNKLLLDYCPEISHSIKSISKFIKAEGIALAPNGDKLLVGLRNRDSKDVFVAELYQLDLGQTKTEAELILKIQNLYDKEGISSIEYDNYHNIYLLLTSIELEGDRKEDVSGYLWALTLDPDNNIPRAVRILKLSHKPEGVAVTSTGDIIIVFDDDANRKAAFNLKQNESCYQVVPEKIFSRKVKESRL